MLNWVDFVPAPKPYRIGLLLSHKNSDLGAISVTGRSRPVPISKVENNIPDRCHNCKQGFGVFNFV